MNTLSSMYMSFNKKNSTDQNIQPIKILKPEEIQVVRTEPLLLHKMWYPLYCNIRSNSIKIHEWINHYNHPLASSLQNRSTLEHEKQHPLYNQSSSPTYKNNCAGESISISNVCIINRRPAPTHFLTSSR